MLQRLQLGLELLLLTLLQVGLIELGQLIAQVVLLFATRAILLLQAGIGLQPLAPPAVVLAVVGQQSGIAGHGIDHPQLKPRVGQQHVLVLRMYVDELFAQGFQLSQ